MKLEYNEIISDYIANESALYIALEAIDNSSSNQTKDNRNNDNDLKEMTDATTKLSNPQKFVIVLRKIVDAIATAIRTCMEKLKNRFQLFFESDKGFKKQLRKREVMTKPVTGLEIINYEYDEIYLYTLMNKLSNEYSKAIVAANTVVDNPNKASDNMDDYHPRMNVLDFMEKVSGTKHKSVNDFLATMKKKFRGKKIKRKYFAAQIPEIIKKAEDLNKGKVFMSQLDTKTRTTLKIVEAKVKKYQYNNSGDTEGIKKATAQLKLIAEINNFYMTVATYYSELLIEQCMAYRMICRRMYQF